MGISAIISPCLKQRSFWQNSRVVDAATSNKKIGLGSKIKVVIDGLKQTLEIVTEFDSNFLEGKISYASPIAQAMLGKKAGDKIKVKTLQGETGITILKILWPTLKNKPRKESGRWSKNPKAF